MGLPRPLKNVGVIHMPRFSIVIPCYNSGRWIRRALDSAFCQPGNDFEVIVVDDGSTDDTLCLLKRYGRGLRVLTQDNQGAGVARNHGISKSTGEYIAFLDADDVWFPWTLSTYRQLISRFERPSVIAGTARRFVEDSDLAHLAVPAEIAGQRFSNFYDAARAGFWFLLPSGLTVRRDIFEACGGYAEGKLNAEDTHLFMKFGVSPGFVAVHLPIVFGYRCHGSNWATDAERNFKGCLRLVMGEKEDLYPGGRTYQWLRRGLLTKHTRPATLACLRRHEFRKGLRLFGATLFWNIRLARLRYLLFFPFLFAWEILNPFRGEQKHMPTVQLD
jgi:glycosyltransferase involved in cell wall biosynthesis